MGFEWAELTNEGEYLKFFIGLIAISNIVGTIPIFLGLTGRYSRPEANLAGIAAGGVFILILVAFAIFSNAILDSFSISISAFQAAGGLLILLSGLQMVRSTAEEDGEESQAASPFGLGVTPLGMPLLAGPGAITYVFIASSLHEGAAHTVVLSASIVGVGVVIMLALLAASGVSAFIKPTLRQFLQKLLGLIVMSLGTEYIFHGIAVHFAMPVSGH